MKKFIELNKTKAVFMIKFCFIVFGTFFFGMTLILAYFNIETLNYNNYIFGFISTISLTFWISILAFFSWFLRNRKRTKLLQKHPLNKLSEIGFQDYLKNEKSKWFFTETIKAGYISNYFISLDLHEKSFKTISFKTFVDFQRFDSLKNERLKSKNITVNFLEASKDYNTKDIGKLSFNQLKNDLEEFTRILSYENLKPINDSY
ncbi:hypothetical protein [Tenacibaculum sp. 190524A05c]|uniref:Uncharacterized protein n=1 Tax=Tenacibaculum platacis TaxID=3137852 RepID=A0ABP1EP90_9FLAO